MGQFQLASVAETFGAQMTTYRLVPVEASREMTDAAEYLVRRHGELVRGQGIWEAMLSAAPVPSKQSELLEAAKEVAIAMSVYVPSAVAVQHASVEWKRTYEAYHRLRTAIRNAEQAQGTPTQ